MRVYLANCCFNRPFDDQRQTQANKLADVGLKAKDALHIACAIAGSCLYFVTTDDDLLKRQQDIQDIAVIDPTSFVRENNL